MISDESYASSSPEIPRIGEEVRDIARRMGAALQTSDERPGEVTEAAVFEQVARLRALAERTAPLEPGRNGIRQLRLHDSVRYFEEHRDVVRSFGQDFLDLADLSRGVPPFPVEWQPPAEL